ncbi:hypothetical protein [uncultured Bacteroides sp.]|jgi:hypothetical protein|uniref:hypothetical protein n=1 Tax=uncultured Bacteroides sp. TaxID=162156 RepID=UPI00204B4877|nr:hypothetical protein [Bacteroides intestinalis]DAS84553.1 MAG TPA: hypothetical protein [Caudoviricetes sp.]DAU57779.1 MAG TPA: hypothetical protein [Caudoviricetes sp.]
MAKGYNRRNFLLRVKDIQDIYLQHHARGCTDKFIYQNHIYPTYKIGRTTFYNYLATPAVKELKELEERMRLEREERARQLSMFGEEESDFIK